MTVEDPKARMDAYYARMREEQFRDSSIAWGYGIVGLWILIAVVGILITAPKSDVNADGVFTISYVLQAAGAGFTSVATFGLAQLGPEFWKFFEIAPSAIPAWITFPVAIVIWLLSGYVIGAVVHQVALVVRTGSGVVHKRLPGTMMGDIVVGGILATFIVFAVIAWISSKIS